MGIWVRLREEAREAARISNKLPQTYLKNHLELVVKLLGSLLFSKFP